MAATALFRRSRETGRDFRLAHARRDRGGGGARRAGRARVTSLRREAVPAPAGGEA